MQELQANGVEIYSFPTDDESVSEVNSGMNSHIPFAVVGSTDFVKCGNKTVRARQYPWGTVQGNLSPIFFKIKLIIKLLGHELIPFVVDVSTDFVKYGNKTVRARQYPWGTVLGNVSLVFCDIKFIIKLSGDELIPFAVDGSTDFVKCGNKTTR